MSRAFSTQIIHQVCECWIACLTQRVCAGVFAAAHAHYTHLQQWWLMIMIQAWRSRKSSSNTSATGATWTCASTSHIGKSGPNTISFPHPPSPGKKGQSGTCIWIRALWLDSKNAIPKKTTLCVDILSLPLGWVVDFILQASLNVTVFVSCLVLWNFFQKSNFRPLLGKRRV